MSRENNNRVVLVTGVNGFTGRHVAAALNTAGYRVAGLGQSGTSAGEYRVCDLRDRGGLERIVKEVRPDFVIHLAAVSFVAHGNIDLIYQTNVVGTRNLLSALDACGHRPKSVVLASSAQVYGATERDPLDESTPFCPANDYATSKVAMEYMAYQWMKRLPICITRPFNYSGRGQAEHFLLPKIVKHFKEGRRRIELGNLDVSRDFMDVRAVSDAYVRLLESNAAGETFNICSGKATPLQVILQTMSRIAGYDIEVRTNPAFVRSNEIKRLRGSNKKIKNLIGDLDDKPLEETLRWMFASQTRA